MNDDDVNDNDDRFYKHLNFGLQLHNRIFQANNLIIENMNELENGFKNKRE